MIEGFEMKVKCRKVLWVKHDMIIPDDFVTCGFEQVFTSQSVPSTTRKELKDAGVPK